MSFAPNSIHEIQAETAANELSRHIRSLCDRHFTTRLDDHVLNAKNADIAIVGLLFFPSPWNSHWFSLISGISQVPDILESGNPETEPYQHFLLEFFEDKDRSGNYYLDGIIYARAALECFRNMANINDESVCFTFLWDFNDNRIK
jgi:hypothetical protein